ncbi:MAG TPA: LUD domain-containing protein [Anaerolineales bacterium]|nr:LUD domain-containing protein [Anaerolineales bacterium]
MTERGGDPPPAVEGALSSTHGPRPALGDHRGSAGSLQSNAAGPASQRISDPARVERFRRELEALGGIFHLCAPESVNGEVISLLKGLDPGKLMAWTAAELPDGLIGALQDEGLAPAYEWGTEDGNETGAQPTVGLTAALAGIAETGTLVLPAGPGRSLSASLLPEIHIALLQGEDLVDSLPQALALPEVREASSTVLISGPSRTADIEMTLTVGVHGPRLVHVFCILNGG